MKSHLLSLAICFMMLDASAQVPGYMGKRLAFFYEPNFFLNLQPNGLESGQQKIGLNWRNDLAADYTVGKNVALGGSVKIISTHLNNTDIYDYNTNLEFSGNIKINSPVFSVYIKKFSFSKRGYLSPVGVFTKWEFVYGKVQGKGEKLLPVPNPGEYISVNDIRQVVPGKQTVYGFIFSFGRQNLFLDRLFINTGGSFGFFPGGIRYYTLIGSSYNTSADNYQAMVQYRMFGYFFFNFNLGIGLLTL